jgi:hypothetical protein
MSFGSVTSEGSTPSLFAFFSFSALMKWMFSLVPRSRLPGFRLWFLRRYVEHVKVRVGALGEGRMIEMRRNDLDVDDELLRLGQHEDSPPATQNDLPYVRDW